MKNVIIILLVVASLFSCNKKELKVPRVAMQGDEKVADHSIIWMFYDEDKGIDVNEKNRISSTNWFFNVDKKITLDKLFPKVLKLIDKHNKKSPHNTKPMKNYFTYVNSLNDQLSFYQIDSINYKIIKKEALPKFQGDTILVNVGVSDLQIPTTEKNTIIQAVYDSQINFQKYMETKALFSKEIKIENLSTTEYIITH